MTISTTIDNDNTSDHEDKHSYWHVKRAADDLSNSMLLTDEANCKNNYAPLISLIQEVLLSWHARWSGQSKWQSFLNKSSLLHEVEESVVALHNLLSWLESFENSPSADNDDEGQIVVVDLCAGKGFFSMLLTYLHAKIVSSNGDCKTDLNAQNDKSTSSDPDDDLFQCLAPLRKIGKCIMIDRMNRRKCNWHHIDAANDDESTRIQIELWSGCNVHDEDFLPRLENVPGQLAIVGIHLCKTLSPRCLSIGNTFGCKKVPFLCLAPCCLPRIGMNQAKVQLYETESEKNVRLNVRDQRNRALQKICSICSDKSHGTKYCPTLPNDPEEKKSLLNRYKSCWRCGKFGHGLSECTEARMPSLIEPPCIPIDLSKVDGADSPFDNYCDQLLESIQSTAQSVSQEVCIEKDLRVVLLKGNSDGHDRSYSDNNRIGQRKCTWITRTCVTSRG